ncbi:zinc finger, CCHC-type containing protein [Tanacetum coccineum]|uniref:Zinc finger, CCHC-type containing protein n=1 Tax=Tanacetum coccineum TaxID=301880 RepID=A0ABQ5HUX7_9ASTR
MLSVDDMLNYLEHLIHVAHVPAHAGQEVPPEALAAHGIENYVFSTIRAGTSLNRNRVSRVQAGKGQSVSSYILKMKSYIDNLECLGYCVSLNLAVSLILVSLRKEYDSFVQNYNYDGTGETVNEFHAMLKHHEQTLPKKDAPALHAIGAGKVQKKNNKNKKPQLVARGNNQGKGKSKLAYAPKPKIPPPFKKENPQSITNAVIQAIGSETVYDTGCGTHISNTTQGLWGSRKLKPGPLSLYMGNGQHAAVEAIGYFHLCLLSGLVLILHNCYYAPSITRGIISVSCLYDDGFINHFEDNAISVFRNNLVYFCAVPRDGIYEIDFSNSNTNDSSMYAVSNKRAKLNLDSALLWHYRLGHINKKRIEKLQHDGLLNSTNSKSFEKTLLDMVRSMMSQTTLLKSFWDYAVESAARILNMVPTKKVEKTPYVVWHGQSLKMSYLRVWGCEALVLVARNAEFFKNILINQEASGSLKDIKIIQLKDTYPSVNTSSHHDEDEQEIDEPQSNIFPIRRSTKTRHALYQMCLYIDAEEHELGYLNETANYKASLLDPESDK